MCFVCLSAGLKSGESSGHIDYQPLAPKNTLLQTTAALELTDEIEPLIYGYSWSGQVDTAATITYTFETDNRVNASNAYADSWTAFNADQQTATLGVFAKLSDITNVTFIESSSAASADIAFYVGDITFEDTLGITDINTSGNTLTATTVGMDVTVADFTLAGAYEYWVLLHEIGHAMGLKHPGNYSGSEQSPFLPEGEDNTSYTVMSYNDSDSTILTNPSNYQEYDINALQYLYGEREDTGSGGSGDSGDGGSSESETPDYSQGIGDVEDFVTGVEVTGIGETDGSDVLLAAVSGSEVYGGHGADSVYGYNGNDTIYGGQGIADSGDEGDVLMGGAASDLMYGNTGGDTIYGAYEGVTSQDTADTIYGGFGEDSIFGNLGDDYLAGGGGVAHPDDDADQIYGGYGNDSILGNGGDDTIVASFGDDTIYGGYGADSIDGGDDNDYIVGQFGDETMTGGAGRDTFYFSGSDGNDIITDFSTDDVLRFRAHLNGTTIETAAQALVLFSFSGDDAIMTFSASASITLTGVTEGEIGLGNIEII